MIYEILDGETVINTIVADPEFVAKHFPNGNYRQAAQPTPAGPSQKELAALELAAIDKETGMSRTMRETLLLIANKLAVPVPYLAEREEAASVARAKLKA